MVPSFVYALYTYTFHISVKSSRRYSLVLANNSDIADDDDDGTESY